MYEKAKEVILSGDYELTAAVATLEIWALKGTISREQADELIQLAREHADVTQSLDILKTIEDHEKRLRALEQGGSVSGSSEEWPEYVVGRSYYNGDKVTFEGRRYTCNLPEHTTVCVWSPKDYPAYWQAA